MPQRGEMSETIVRLEGVSKRYGAADAVRDVSLVVRRGEFVSLLGPSGCGKSTILRMIGGFEQPDAGAIEIDGADVVDVPPNRRPVNLVFQSYALFPHLSVFDNVAFGLRRKRLPRSEVGERTRRFLALAGLESFGDRYPAQLSGGQQQRVALARALVNQPKVLLLDEPLGALDLKLRKRMQVELKQLQREVGISFIYVTHDQDEALALSDRIAVMNQGTILQYDAGREIYDRPRTEFVANFLGEANVLRGRVLATGPAGIVEIAGKSMPATVDGARPGDAASVAIRPESLELRAEGADVLPCVVEDRVFLGSSFVVYLRTAAGEPLMLRGFDRRQLDGLRTGEAVGVTWRADLAHVVAP
ncbi:MAG: ABC transporter ATP-binding protein [Alphaproteobacteria bacterium]|nr:ABC transporter ATP-binding protein [Alphaproteobacteria bacterium]